MFLDHYFRRDGADICISAEQGSRFAKQEAGDFNPIHDATSKRFCVPGDLLFALVLTTKGLSQRMTFGFSGMLGAEIPLRIAEADRSRLAVQDARDKTYLEVTRDGEISRDQALIEALVRGYVRFSGRNFPHILVPLMREHGMMINTERPLVVYESMAFELNRLDLRGPTLELLDSRLDVRGKRGEARLYFALRQGETTIGTGFKKLVLSGLREYQEEQIQGLVDRYAGWKAAYEAG
jgi:hypothetical protein